MIMAGPPGGRGQEPGSPVTLGLLYPGHSAEDDFGVVERSFGSRLRLPLTHTAMASDAHRPDELRAWGRAATLADGAAALAAQRPDAIAWACTSGSFVLGWQGAQDQAAELSRRCGLPATSTSLAFVYAARSLGIDRVAVAASYPDDVARLFVDFLAAAGIGVANFGAADMLHAADVGHLDRSEVLAMAAEADNADAGAVLVPDTAMHTLARVADLEAAVGKPVLTANQVTLWHGLHLLDFQLTADWLGRLFQEAGEQIHGGPVLNGDPD
jgi:maleate cis-trans isomerase